MKNKFIALLYIALCMQAYTLMAKNDSTSVIKNGIGISVAPMFSMPYYVTKNNFNTTSTPLTGRVGVAAAICENIVLSKKHNFYLYAELGYLGTASADNSPSIFLANNNSISYKLIETMHNGFFSLSIQKVLFHVTNKFGLFLGIGAQVNYCFAISQTMEQVNNVNGKTTTTTQTTTNYNTSSSSNNIQANMAAAAVARVGVLITPIKHLSINIAPVFNYGLNPRLVLTKNDNGLNSIGLNAQIMFNF